MKSLNQSRVGLKHFKVDSCVSYLVWDRSSRQAAIVDPQMHAMEQYRSEIAEKGLRLGWAIDTHTHTDHFSATHFFRDLFGAGIAGSSRAGSKRVQRALGEGDRLEVGGLALRVLEVPGHTSDSICLAGEGLLFSGDSLWVGGSGPVDFEGGDPELLWNSLRKAFGNEEGLGGDLVVLPAHDGNDILFSTLETERKREADWAALPLEDFLNFKLQARVAIADMETRTRIDFNLSQAPTLDVANLHASTGPRHELDLGFIGIAAINVEKFENKLNKRKSQQDGTAFIDVREHEEFEQTRIEGVMNLPLSELPLHLSDLKAFKRIYICDLSGQRSSRAVKTLSYIGLPDVVNVTGGLKAWMQAGLPVVKKD